IVIFKYVNGILLSKYDLITVFYSELEEIISTLIFEYYTKIAIEHPKKVYLSLSEEILKNLSESLKIQFLNPNKGVKKDVMDKAFSNAVEIMKNKYLLLISNQTREMNSVDESQKILNIENIYRIEMFDNSNIFNDDKVGAMIVYENGVKNKN
ncbi:MAG: hypothetical protein K2J98_00005, partial [Malacoplasma sp.]|nr:hypothetical protein [Malacoplasma sp.]